MHYLAAPPPSQHVQPEFRGLARAARTRFMAWAEVAGPKMRAIEAYTAAAYKSRTTTVPLRTLQSVVERWRAISLEGCLSQSINLTGRNLTISDVRATASTATNETWDGTEHGICIIANSLRCRKAQVVWQAPILAGCSLHALARWHQRGLLTTPDQLMADLKLLAALAPRLIVSMAPEFSIPTNGGQWVGRLAQSPENTVFCDVRSFVWT
jgi:hypothetical protein